MRRERVRRSSLLSPTGNRAASPLPWTDGPPDPATELPDLATDVVRVARQLLGCVLVSTVDGRSARGVIVETEAYGGPEDPASHASERIGRTRRNETMYGPPGRAYVYRSYGVHWCLNVVTGPVDYPAAVLIRGLEPLAGIDAMTSRRSGREPLAAGPGRLCQALGITGDLDGHPLDAPPLELRAGWPVEDHLVGVTGRVGIRHAADWPRRFFVLGSSAVSDRAGRSRTPPPPEDGRSA